jgi:uncharacterized coiled-coil DUF342 family protein
MQIKFVKIYLSGGSRIQELYEAGKKKDAKIEELEKAIRFKQLQHKGYGKELAAQLKEIEELKAKAAAMAEDRDEWARKYQESEKARKSLGEKLEKAMGAIELIRGTTPPSAAPTPPLAGEARAVDGAGRYKSNAGEIGGARA